MPKISAFVLISLLLLRIPSSRAARPDPTSSEDTNRQGLVEEEEHQGYSGGCEGVNEDECLMRRTLIAHVDYIYTQKKKN